MMRAIQITILVMSYFFTIAYLIAGKPGDAAFFFAVVANIRLDMIAAKEWQQ